MEIKELKKDINILSREFLKLEKQFSSDQNFILEQQKEIKELKKKEIDQRIQLNNKLNQVENFGQKIKRINLIHNFFIGVIGVLVIFLAIVSWKLKTNEQQTMNLKNEIVKVEHILLNKEQFWYDKKDYKLYLRPIKDLKKEKKK